MLVYKIGSTYFNSPIITGDYARRVTHAGNSYYTSTHKDGVYRISDTKKGDLLGFYTVDGVPNIKVYKLRIKIDNSWFEAHNFELKDKRDNIVVFDTNKVATPALEMDRPTFVREFIETYTAGEDSPRREYIGDFIQFNSLSAARAYTAEEISKSIREKNTYRQFSIIVENSVARAKKPEIEFA